MLGANQGLLLYGEVSVMEGFARVAKPGKFQSERFYKGKKTGVHFIESLKN